MQKVSTLLVPYNFIGKVLIQHERKFNCSVIMPKSKSNKKSNKVNDNHELSVQSPVSCNKSGCVEIKIVAKPGAKISSITGIEEEGVGVQIGAPPVDGEANEELVKFISKALNLKKSCVNLSRGSKSRQKIIVLSDCTLTCDQVIDKLKSHMDS